jgi:hypothetical protein
VANAGEDALDRTKGGVATAGMANAFAPYTIFLVGEREGEECDSVERGERTLEGVNGCGQGPQGNVTEAKKIVSCGAGSAGVLPGAEEKVEGEGETIRRGADGRQRRAGTGQGNGHAEDRYGQGWDPGGGRVGLAPGAKEGSQAVVQRAKGG